MLLSFSGEARLVHVSVTKFTRLLFDFFSLLPLRDKKTVHLCKKGSCAQEDMINIPNFLLCMSMHRHTLAVA